MKISLNTQMSSLLIEAKSLAGGLTFNQLLTEALEHIHNKYVHEGQNVHKESKQEGSWLFLREVT